MAEPPAGRLCIPAAHPRPGPCTHAIAAGSGAGQRQHHAGAHHPQPHGRRPARSGDRPATGPPGADGFLPRRRGHCRRAACGGEDAAVFAAVGVGNGVVSCYAVDATAGGRRAAEADLPELERFVHG